MCSLCRRFVAISTHAPRTGSDPQYGGTRIPGEDISTHAPRTGSDDHLRKLRAACSHFNPRSPHGERPDTPEKTALNAAFQPTLPARGATTSGDTIPPPSEISTHAPRTGSDLFLLRICVICILFQPTLPARGATSVTSIVSASASNFNPRSPHGERQPMRWELLTNTRFQPTLPARGATLVILWSGGALIFQPTLPARGATDAR